MNEGVNLFFLCEHTGWDDELFREGLPNPNDWRLLPAINLESKIKAYTSLPEETIKLVYEDKRGTFFDVYLRGKKAQPIKIGALHLESLIHTNEEDKRQEAEWFLTDNNLHEEDRLILIGDFNSNPYDSAMMAVNGFNATLSKRIAKQKIRTFKKHKSLYFYNPFWSFIGDWFLDPAGTFYWNPTHINKAHWNIYDQILIRPALLPYFEKKDSIKIITEMDGQSLLTRDGLPNKKFSDHLPIQFSIKVEFLFI